MENLRNRIDVRLESNEKDYLKGGIKTKLYVTKILDSNLITIHKNKVT